VDKKALPPAGDFCGLFAAKKCKKIIHHGRRKNDLPEKGRIPCDNLSGLLVSTSVNIEVTLKITNHENITYSHPRSHNHFCNGRVLLSKPT